MATKRMASGKFIVTTIIVLLLAWVNTALTMGGLSYFLHVVKNPYYSGAMIGTSVKWLAIAFVFTMVINFIANRFRKEQKPFSYLMVWTFLLIIIVGTYINILEQLGIEQPSARYTFIQGCISNAKTSTEYRALKPSDQQHAIYAITEYCAGVANGYFKAYDQCMKMNKDQFSCNKLALFSQCMIMKNDKIFCQSFMDSFSIK